MSDNLNLTPVPEQPPEVPNPESGVGLGTTAEPTTFEPEEESEASPPPPPPGR